MTEMAILLKRVGAVAQITLNRPNARNALSRALCSELLQTLATVRAMTEAGEVRAATLNGAGKAFCAGADLKERAGMEPEAASAHSQIIAACADQLAALPCPVIACINGAALGGGLELALACDLRVVSADSVLGFPELTYGFFPGAGGPVRLVRLVGISTATYLMMSTTRISGEEAVHLHLANELAPSRAANQRGFELAEKIASFPAKGVRALRQLLASLDVECFAENMAQARVMRDRLNDDVEVRNALAGFG